VTFKGVMLQREGLVALLAEDGTTATMFSGDDNDSQELASLLAELHRCGLPAGVTVTDEWLQDGVWVTVWG